MWKLSQDHAICQVYEPMTMKLPEVPSDSEPCNIPFIDTHYEGIHSYDYVYASNLLEQT